MFLRCVGLGCDSVPACHADAIPLFAVIPFAGASTAAPCLAIVGVAVIVAIVNACQCSTSELACQGADNTPAADVHEDGSYTVVARSDGRQCESESGLLLCETPPTT